MNRYDYYTRCVNIDEQEWMTEELYYPDGGGRGTSWDDDDYEDDGYDNFDDYDDDDYDSEEEDSEDDDPFPGRVSCSAAGYPSGRKEGE